MSFLSIYLASLAVLSVASASKIPVSVGGKESNVTSITSVLLPPSFSGQISKETSNILADEPSSVEYHQMDGPSKLLDSLREEYEELLKTVEERKATHSKAREEFNLKKGEDMKELEKLDLIVKEREDMEKKMEEEKANLEKMRTDIDEEERIVKEEEDKVADLIQRKNEANVKDEELKKLTAELAVLERKVETELGECIEVPEKLMESWRNHVHEDIRLCYTREDSK